MEILVALLLAVGVALLTFCDVARTNFKYQMLVVICVCLYDGGLRWLRCSQ